MTIRVRAENKRGKKVWAVNQTIGGKRSRSYWPSERAALNEAARLRDLNRQAGSDWAQLTDDERNALAALWARAKRDGVDLVRLFDERPTAPVLASVGLSVAIGQLLESKRASGCRPAYLTNLRQCLEAFARGRESQTVETVTVGDVEDWLREKGGTAHTRAMWRSRLATLFGWCVRREYLTRNPVAAVDAVRIDYQPPRILTVEESRTLMKLAREHHFRVLPWFALGLFAGIRPSELDRLGWSSVNLDAGTVTIDAAAAKVRQRLIVTLEPVAVAWMREAQGAQMPVPVATRRRALRDLRERMGWEEWPADILRHTAASYLLAHHQDAGRVAMNLGNSPGVLFRHYRELVTRDDAEKWLALTPPTSATC